MTPERWKEMLPLINHYVNGGKIEFMAESDGQWHKADYLDPSSIFNRPAKYRIAGNRVAREYWIDPSTNSIWKEYPPHGPNIFVREVLE